MLDTLTHDQFQALVGQKVAIEFIEGAPTQAEVASTKRISQASMPERREAFSVLFRVPDATYPQRIYTLHHPTLGAMGLFLVPIGPDAQGLSLYEAVFT